MESGCGIESLALACIEGGAVLRRWIRGADAKWHIGSMKSVSGIGLAFVQSGCETYGFIMNGVDTNANSG